MNEHFAKRFWIWRIKIPSGDWLRTSLYLDEQGRSTSGKAGFQNNEWGNLEKEKIDRDFMVIIDKEE